MNMWRNIFLIGPMGAGKTTIGRQLAQRLEVPFFDSDGEIEKRTGVSVPVIFEIEGETGFRKREKAMIDELTQLQGIILATGGGAILDPVNREHLHERGLCAFLHAPIDVLVQRTSHDRNRPLLHDTDPDERLTALMEQRGPYYRETAHFDIDTHLAPTKIIVNQIVEELEQRRQERP